MRVLLIKTSSLGDIIHTLPSLTDAAQQFSNIQFDWVVEGSFQTVPKWHSAIGEVIPVALRCWRKQWCNPQTIGEIFASIKKIRTLRYDAILDAQGLLKSAALSLAARGPCSGFSWHSAREKTASLFYQHRISVPWSIHAVNRTRMLFAKALHYPVPQTTPNYGIDPARLPAFSYDKPYYVFFHGTTWETKLWPNEYWAALAKRFEQIGEHIIFLPGNAREEADAQLIAKQVSNIQIIPKLNIAEVAGVLSRARGAVAVDTGFGHLAAALAIPTVSLYGPTDPNRTGTVGQHQIHLAADFPCAPCLSRTCSYQGHKTIDPPCFTKLSPDLVFERLQAATRALKTRSIEVGVA